MKKILIFLFFVLFLLPAHAEFEIHYLDVGQGDSAIILCDGESMIIDGGPVSASSLLYSYIRNTLQLAEVNIVVATHPHDDHIGGIPAILNAAPVGVILSPVAAWDSSTFSSVIKYANLQGCPITVPSVGDVYTVGSAEVTIISCWPEAWIVNDMSIILRVDYGDTSFLFTGDAEVMAEYVTIDSGLPLEADVLKVGHHGSHSSSCLEFLKAVSPKAAVISCGADNTYGHPHIETLNNLNSVKAEVLRTDIYGTIICRSDGRSILFESKKNEVIASFTNDLEEEYIGDSTKTIFHRPNCNETYRLRMQRSQVRFEHRRDAIEAGYAPCPVCNP